MSVVEPVRKLFAPCRPTIFGDRDTDTVVVRTGWLRTRIDHRPLCREIAIGQRREGWMVRPVGKQLASFDDGQRWPPLPACQRRKLEGKSFCRGLQPADVCGAS